MIGTSEIFLILYVLVFVFVIVFWLWMLIDCLKRQDFKFGGNHARLIWVMVLIFSGIIGFGALIYYFLIKRTDSNQDRLISIALLACLALIVILIASGFTVTEATSSIEAYHSNKLPQYTPTVTMNGTFQIVNIPACPFNVQCNPKYQLAVEDGNTSQLLFSSGTRLPDDGQHIEVTGIVNYDTISKCELNGEEIPCQPVGRVSVTSWQPHRLQLFGGD